jgi:lysophospholipase
MHFIKFYFALLTIFICLAETKAAETQKMILPDDAHIRLAHWLPHRPSTHPATILLLQGRSSYIEKFDETIEDLRNLGYEVWTFDWRGSGGSSRLISSNTQKVHIDSYETYINDLDYIIRTQIKSENSQPLILMGISMGGHLALRYLEEKPNKVAGAFLIAPMLNIHTNPYPCWLGRLMVTTATWLGFGNAYAFGYGDYNPNQKIDPKKVGTTDLVRYQRQLDLNLSKMSLVTAGPTFGWAYETFKSIDLVNAPSSLKKISVPVMIIRAGQEMVVDNSEDPFLCSHISQCQIKTYDKARHNIFIEQDAFRHQLFKDLEEFTSTLSMHYKKAM